MTLSCCPKANRSNVDTYFTLSTLFGPFSLYVPKYIPLTIDCTPLSKSITPCHVSSVSFCPLATGEMRCCFSFPLIVSKVLWFCVHSLYPICKHMLVAAVGRSVGHPRKRRSYYIIRISVTTYYYTLVQSISNIGGAAVGYNKFLIHCAKSREME